MTEEFIPPNKRAIALWTCGNLATPANQQPAALEPAALEPAALEPAALAQLCM